MSTGMFALIILGLVVFAASSALLSGIETALFSLRPYHVERLRKRRSSLGNGVSKLLENPRRLLSALLLGDTLVNLPLIVLGLFLLDHVFPSVPTWADVLILTVVIVFPCDLFPKLFALSETYRLAKVGVRVMSVLMPIFDPMARVMQRVSEKLADILTPKWVEPIPFLSEDELETLVALSAEAGALHETESEMIQEIIKLGDKTAKDCMTPRVDTVAVPDDLTHEELIPRLRERRFRRVLVYGETPDDIEGVLDTQNFLLDPSGHYTEQLGPPSFVSETMKALDLLRSFLKRPQGMAIVVDEHGGFEGVVTLSDLVEEIISDAVPDSERTLYLEAREDGSLLASGSARLEDIVENTGFALEAEGIDTIGGLIFNRLGTLPRTGATLEIEGYRMTIQRISRKRVEEVLIEPPVTPAEEAEEERAEGSHRGEEKNA